MSAIAELGHKAKKERLCRVFLILGWVLSRWCMTVGIQKRLLITKLEDLWVLLKTYLRIKMNLAQSSLVLCSSSNIITLYEVLFFLEYCYPCITVEKVNSRRLVLVRNSHLKDTNSLAAAVQPHGGGSLGTFD